MDFLLGLILLLILLQNLSFNFYSIFNLSSSIDLPIYGVEKITTKIGGKGASAGLKICCENLLWKLGSFIAFKLATLLNLSIIQVNGGVKNWYENWDNNCSCVVQKDNCDCNEERMVRKNWVWKLFSVGLISQLLDESNGWRFCSRKSSRELCCWGSKFDNKLYLNKHMSIWSTNFLFKLRSY
jgi:hypothetical protein